MKFLKTFESFKNAQSLLEDNNTAQAGKDFDFTKFELKLIIADVSKEDIKADYALFYDGAEFTKGKTILKNSGKSYSTTYNLTKSEYPVLGKFLASVSTKDAKKGAKLVLKKGQSDISITGLYNTELKLKKSIVSEAPSSNGITIEDGFEFDSATLKAESLTKIKDAVKDVDKTKMPVFNVGASQDGNPDEMIQNDKTKAVFGDKQIKRKEWDFYLVTERYKTIDTILKEAGFKETQSTDKPANANDTKNIYGKFDSDLKSAKNRNISIQV